MTKENRLKHGKFWLEVLDGKVNDSMGRTVKLTNGITRDHPYCQEYLASIKTCAEEKVEKPVKKKRGK